MKPDLIRHSAILRRMKREGDQLLLDKYTTEFGKINRICRVHGYLKDPVVVLDTRYKRLVLGCPDCSGPGVRERWEREGDHGLH